MNTVIDCIALDRAVSHSPANGTVNTSVNTSLMATPAPVSITCDVAIVGAGIVGLTLAAALKASGLSVVILEARSQTAQSGDDRAYHISMLSSQIFQRLGIWQQILAASTAFQQIYLADTGVGNVMALYFNSADLRKTAAAEAGAVGYVARHSVLVTALQEYLQGSDHVTWLRPAAVVAVDYGSDGAIVQAALQQTSEPTPVRVMASLVVAADGAKSPVRQAAGIQTRGWRYWQSCITCKVAPERSHQNIAYELFQPSGPFAILPLPDNRCQIVWTAPHHEAKAFVNLDDEAFLAALSQRYGDQMGKLALASDRHVFPVQLMQSDRYVLPRLALVGDAAHCCHPVGGQGLNMGIRDAAALAQVLQTAHQRQEDIGSLAVLRRYGAWRFWETLMVLGFTDLLDRLFSTTWLPIVVLRRLGLRLLQAVPPLKSFALRFMTGLTGRSPLTDPTT